MSIRDVSWKAVLVGCLVIVVSWPIFLFLAAPIEMIVSNLVLGEPWTDLENLSIDKYLAEQLALFRWSTLIITLAGVIISYGLGGYFAARIAKTHHQLHALLVVFVVVLAFSVYAFAVSEPNLFQIARTSVIGVLAALLGSRMAIRAKVARVTN